MKSIRVLSLFIAITLCLSSCGVPKYATLSAPADLAKYKYFYVAPTSERISVSGGTYGNQYGVYGSTSSNSTNPSDVIAGYFIKRGFACVPEINEKIKPQTFIVNFSESGRKNYALGLAYSIEVTLQILDAATYEVVCTSSAEGMGETEADDVRKALLKCLVSILP